MMTLTLLTAIAVLSRFSPLRVMALVWRLLGLIALASCFLNPRTRPTRYW